MNADQAMAVFGQMSGMAMPLIYFPTALLTSLSITLVPAVSEAAALCKIAKIRQTISKSVLFACVTGFGAAGLFLSFPDELGMVIYNQPIGNMLFILGLMCPFLYLQIIFSGILNGLGKQVFIFKVSLLSSAINILFIYFLVPYRGVSGFMLGWFVSLVLACIFEIQKIRESVKVDLDFINWIGKPILAAAASGLTAKWLNRQYFMPLMGEKPGLLLSVCLLALLFCIFIVICGVINLDDMTRIFMRNNKSTEISDTL